MSKPTLIPEIDLERAVSTIAALAEFACDLNPVIDYCANIFINLIFEKLLDLADALNEVFKE